MARKPDTAAGDGPHEKIVGRLEEKLRDRLGACWLRPALEGAPAEFLWKSAPEL